MDHQRRFLAQRVQWGEKHWSPGSGQSLNPMGHNKIENCILIQGIEEGMVDGVCPYEPWPETTGENIATRTWL